MSSRGILATVMGIFTLALVPVFVHFIQGYMSNPELIRIAFMCVGGFTLYGFTAIVWGIVELRTVARHPSLLMDAYNDIEENFCDVLDKWINRI